MTSSVPKGALSGMTVIDFSRVLAGPLCAQILGDHGATVIKIEPPAGDETREWGSAVDEDGDGRRTSSGYYRGANRNKVTLSLDLAEAAARDIALRLIARADVLVENFKPGTMERWGLSYERDLRPRFPSLIYCRITGFGHDGPLGGLPGYDAVLQAMTGLMSINGTPSSGPLRMGVPIVDMTTAMNAALGILLALHHRHETGLGQYVEACMWDTGIALQHPHAGNWFIDGKPAGLTGNAHPSLAPYETFDTATQTIFLGIGNNGQFARAAALLGLPELAEDPRFATSPARLENRAELHRILAQRLAREEARSVCALLLQNGVPAGPVHSLVEALNHPETEHRKMTVSVGAYRGTGIPIRLGDTPGEARLAPPRFGEHNREILKALGFDADEIAALIASGAVRETRQA